MQRLFVALRPPAAMRAHLIAAMGGVARARWQRGDQLHLTLRFIGEVDRHQAADIAAALGAVHHPRFALALDRVGQFDRKGRVDALWIGVTPQEEVKALHHKIDRALARVGVAPDARSFLPHITIARFPRSAGPLGSLMPELAGVPAEAFEMNEFCLYESELGHEGATYAILRRYPLA
ncbi:MAG TPA: RNA 2',3'-cyclic phosphodiesterase [Sphingomonadaceae bacterium]|nr:RNA 2',3'-cyclic phosphodiesterase [Sphingomonadaceae bacterium]